MNKRELRKLLGIALQILSDNLDFPEMLIFNIKQYLPNNRKVKPDVLFVIKVGEKLRKEWNKIRKIGKPILELKLKGIVFLVEVRLSVQPRFLRNTIANLQAMTNEKPNWYPLIVTQYIGPNARSLCRRERVSYIDSIGNVGIFVKDSIILKDSKKGFKREKRKLRNLFSPKSARIIRILLENPKVQWALNELAEVTDVSIGQTYNVIDRLLEEEYITKIGKRIQIVKAKELLDQWGSVYTFTNANEFESYYSPIQNYPIAIKMLTATAKSRGYNYALTLFAGANYIMPYIRTSIVHLYLLGDPIKFTKQAKLRPVTSGGNIHLILPYDKGVLNPIQKVKGVRIVGNIQLYLDLLNYPARGKEQAILLRENKIRF
jgi:DNA-binding Lrp family transcriptional regulator